MLLGLSLLLLLTWYGASSVGLTTRPSLSRCKYAYSMKFHASPWSLHSPSSTSRKVLSKCSVDGWPAQWWYSTWAWVTGTACCASAWCVMIDGSTWCFAPSTIDIVSILKTQTQSRPNSFMIAGRLMWVDNTNLMLKSAICYFIIRTNAITMENTKPSVASTSCACSALRVKSKHAPRSACV